jgi:hypothetical protein
MVLLAAITVFLQVVPVGIGVGLAYAIHDGAPPRG